MANTPAKVGIVESITITATIRPAIVCGAAQRHAEADPLDEREGDGA